jgi:hypothetical protein
VPAVVRIGDTNPGTEGPRPRRGRLPWPPPPRSCIGETVTLPQASSHRPVPDPGMGMEVAKSPEAARLEATGGLNTSAVVNSPRTLAGMGRQGISPPHRGSSPIPLGWGAHQGNLPPGDDPHEGESGAARRRDPALHSPAGRPLRQRVAGIPLHVSSFRVTPKGDGQLTR